MDGDPPEPPKKRRGNPNLNKSRKSKYGRSVKGGPDKKRTSFDYAEARVTHGLPTNTPSQQVVVHSIYYHKMWHSEACIKDKKEVTKILKLHKKGALTDAAMYEILKDNIRMRTKGLGFDKDCEPDFHIAWSCQGEKKTINELAQHLKWCIVEEKKWEIPPEPKVELPQKPNMAMLGTPAADVVEE